MKLPKFTALLLAGALFLSVTACGKPSVEGSETRYKANKDKLSVLITKQPTHKAEFEKKIAEFEAEYTTAMAAGSDEEKIKKLGELNSRMDKYIAEFDKKDDKQDAGGAEAPSDKLDGAGGAAPTGTAPAVGGKLDGPAGGTAEPASGGMGGGGQPASGMGGGAPAGGTPPAQPAGGMGGM
jgi:hypothetical protein